MGEESESPLFRARVAWLRESGNAALVQRGLRGIEKESLRVTPAGRLSSRPHPRALGSALTHPYLTTDYSEALLEIVTPACQTTWETLQFLCDVHGFVYRHIDDELLWAASMPCLMEQHEIPIAQYGRSNLGRLKTVYRHGLGHRYGRAMQAIAGVHFNYSLPDVFWPAFAERENAQDRDEVSFKSAHYMGLVRNYRRYAWLVIYLFGASPAFCKSFRPEGHASLLELDRGTWYAPFSTSLRMSEFGYRNKTQARLSISANSLEEYVNALADAVSTPDPTYASVGVLADGEYRQLNANVLQIENEYYSSIRPKPKKLTKDRPTVALRRHGVEYVEVRTLDVSAADPVGVNQTQLRFLETLLIYCLLKDSPPISAEEQAGIDARDLLVAREGRAVGLMLEDGGRRVRLSEWGNELLDELAEVAELLESDGEGYVAAIEAQRTALAEGLTPAARVLESIRESGRGFFEHTLELSRAHRAYLMALPTDAAKEALFERLAAESLRDTAALEAADRQSFDEFLAEYLQAT